MEWVTTDEPGLRVVVVREPSIGVDTIDAFKEILEKQVFSAPGDCILHLEGVENLSSLALGLLALAAVMSDKNNKRFAVAAAKESLLKLFVVAGLYNAMRIYNSVESAREKMAAPARPAQGP